MAEGLDRYKEDLHVRNRNRRGLCILNCWNAAPEHDLATPAERNTCRKLLPRRDRCVVASHVPIRKFRAFQLGAEDVCAARLAAQNSTETRRLLITLLALGGAMLDYLRHIDPLQRSVRRFQKQRDVLIAELLAAERNCQSYANRAGARCFATEIRNALENSRGSGANLDSRVDNRFGDDRLTPV